MEHTSNNTTEGKLKQNQQEYRKQIYPVVGHTSITIFWKIQGLIAERDERKYQCQKQQEAGKASVETQTNTTTTTTTTATKQETNIG